MDVEPFQGGRKGLRFGSQKINLHQAGHEFEPKAKLPTPGCADFCLISATPLDDVITGSRKAGYSDRGGTCRSNGRDRTDPVSLYPRSGWEPDRDLQPNQLANDRTALASSRGPEWITSQSSSQERFSAIRSPTASRACR